MRMTPELSDEAVARTSPSTGSRRWVLRAGTVGLFVGGALALGVGTAAMASAAGPAPKPAKAAPAPAPAKTKPGSGTATTSSSSGFGSTCSENSFFSGQPAAGSTVTVGPNNTVKVLYFDESDINLGNGVTTHNGIKPTAPTFLVDGQASPIDVTRGTLFGKGQTRDGFTGQDKYNYVLTASLANVPSSAKTIGIIAFDGDQNKTGGDCGVITWNVAATPPPPPAPAHVGADILLCGSNSPVAGGSISESTGTIATAQPIPSTSVAAGSYNFHAVAPKNFELVSCSHGNATDKSVTVGPGDTQIVHFFVKAVTQAPDVAIIKVASLRKVKVGNTLVYTLVVSNVGRGDTTGSVTVTDTVPTGLTINDVAGAPAWQCGTSGQTVSCNYLDGVISSGQTVATPITITTKVNSDAPSVLVNTGIVDTPGDINPGNNRSTVRTPVTHVLGIKQVKPTKTAVLPFTGSNSRPLIEVALLMLVLGLGLVLLGTGRRRTPVLA